MQASMFSVGGLIVPNDVVRVEEHFFYYSKDFSQFQSILMDVNLVQCHIWNIKDLTYSFKLDRGICRLNKTITI